jgi:anthranilate phosphoribosyltransferase
MTTAEDPGAAGAQARAAVAAACEIVAGGGTMPSPLAEAAMEELMDGIAPPVQVAALLAMLRLRGETPEELAAFAAVMRSRAIRVDAPDGAVDLCGTGADGANTFNISTVAAFVVAGAGAPVAKHGNRAITSRSGSADLVEALGIPLDPGPEAVARAIREIGFGFMFAPSYHPALKHAMPIRRELPMRTIFNLLGPLSSPARVRRQLLGVADPRLVPLVAGALSRLGADRAIVVHGFDGSDELSLAGPNHALLVEDGKVREIVIDAVEVGLRRASLDAIAGGDAQLNSAIAVSILGGEPGPARDVVLLNAAAALFVAGRADDVGDGVAIAAESVDSGAAADVVTRAAGFDGAAT